MKLFVTICAVSWKSAVCHERNKDSLNKVSRGFQIEPPFLSHVSGGAWNATPFDSQNSAIKRCPQCRRPCIIWQHVTFCSRYTFLMVSNPDRIAPGRRLPESTQSILHHYFIRSHAGTNTYLLIIDKFLLIRYQATVKQSTLFLLMVLDLHAGKRLSSFSTILSVLFRVKEHHEQ